MKIINIASFKGNVGDILNHKGFYEHYFNDFNNVSYEQVEIREFYNSAENQKKFDKNYADIINKYDVCIIGGGGFFDARWINSNTGTTLNFEKEFLDNVKIPVIINAMGYHEYPGITSDEIRDKFKRVIQIISEKKNWYISLRNDGSYIRIKEYMSENDIKKIVKVPDNGFLANVGISKNKKCEKIIGMCITNDLFCEEYNKSLTTERFNNIIANFICDYAKKGWKIILFPHTPADVETINKLLINIPDNIKRNAINTAPYSADSEKSVDDLINWYERCRLVVGMRFHSCIINIDLSIPVIALAGHRQLEALYEELELNEYCIKLDNEDFVKKLDRCISEINSEDNYQKLVDRYSDICKRMKCMAVKNKKDMYVFLERNGVINEQ